MLMSINLLRCRQTGQGYDRHCTASSWTPMGTRAYHGQTEPRPSVHTREVYINIHQNTITRVVFLDPNKPFDIIDYIILKLATYELDDRTVGC